MIELKSKHLITILAKFLSYLISDNNVKNLLQNILSCVLAS